MAAWAIPAAAAFEVVSTIAPLRFPCAISRAYPDTWYATVRIAASACSLHDGKSSKHTTRAWEAASKGDSSLIASTVSSDSAKRSRMKSHLPATLSVALT